MAKRFSTGSHADMTITQKVRTILYDAGHGDIVNETIIDGMRDIEQMARGGLDDCNKRLLLLEASDRERLTETSVIRIIKLRAASETTGWLKWGTRAALGGLGAAALAFIGYVIRLAWIGLNAGTAH